ncbi:TPA: DNA polymerase III subunit theta [Klebsiella aerogenes]|uniref:DNA polymerase III subunit theta n=1 Tax=Klebsiella aerogenes TaxID=548 RepID=UPI0007EA645C|nr:DNA polymerase III subunit theta [Klebsiella aerogenes]OAZ29654.1 hypothetical protein A1J85_15365 [Klebsiella aerogenes]
MTIAIDRLKEVTRDFGRRHIAYQMAREQPEHLREYFMERVRCYREQSIQLPRASDQRYIEMAEQNAKK